AQAGGGDPAQAGWKALPSAHGTRSVDRWPAHADLPLGLSQLHAQGPDQPLPDFEAGDQR
ncbi:MAG: hypothetical protein EBU81_12285, partial [Proteobacteria bacterium]|nr:hypothetical protein [Pseudomonadota bacterium]